ncbi:MAG: hypothetical protein OIN66_12375 [Candidatus Methanoperedens sp.]|nr:hypothetical protein [Candidatus Methanoperedens sp.]
MEEIDVAETLKAMSAKIDELSDALTEKRGKVSEAINVGKIKAEEAVKCRPLACLGGAFVGGLALGYLMSRPRKG